MQKRKFVFLLIVVGLFVFFAVISVVHMSTSFAVYKVGKERLWHATLEREYVSTWLNSLEKNTLRRQYGSENIVDDGEFRSIEIRGVGPSPAQDRPYVEGEDHFNVITH